MPDIKKIVVWDSTLEAENELNIRNASDVVINPATEEKQNSIVTALDSVSAKVSTTGSAINAGRKRIVTPGAQIPIGTTTVLSQGVMVTALLANTGSIYVGNSNVNRGADATKQIELLPGSGISISIDDLAKVFIDGDTINDGVMYLGV